MQLRRFSTGTDSVAAFELMTETYPIPFFQAYEPGTQLVFPDNFAQRIDRLCFRAEQSIKKLEHFGADILFRDDIDQRDIAQAIGHRQGKERAAAEEEK